MQIKQRLTRLLFKWGLLDESIIKDAIDRFSKIETVNTDIADIQTMHSKFKLGVQEVAVLNFKRAGFGPSMGLEIYVDSEFKQSGQVTEEGIKRRYLTYHFEDMLKKMSGCTDITVTNNEYGIDSIQLSTSLIKRKACTQPKKL